CPSVVVTLDGIGGPLLIALYPTLPRTANEASMTRPARFKASCTAFMNPPFDFSAQLAAAWRSIVTEAPYDWLPWQSWTVRRRERPRVSHCQEKCYSNPIEARPPQTPGASSLPPHRKRLGSNSVSLGTFVLEAYSRSSAINRVLTRSV